MSGALADILPAGYTLTILRGDGHVLYTVGASYPGEVMKRLEVSSGHFIKPGLMDSLNGAGETLEQTVVQVLVEEVQEGVAGYVESIRAEGPPA